MYTYELGIHEGDSFEEQGDFEFYAPLHKGETVGFETGGNEYTIFEIVHVPGEVPFVHLRPVNSKES